MKVNKKVILSLIFLILMARETMVLADNSGGVSVLATTCPIIGRVKYCHVLFELDYPAKQSTILVFVDGVLVPQSNWRYLANENAVYFERNSYPRVGSTVKITYRTL